MKLYLPLLLIVLATQAFASDMKLFSSANYTGETFVGQTRSVFGDECTLRIETDGESALVRVTKANEFEKEYVFNLNGSYFYRGDYGLQFTDGKRASESNPSIKINFDPQAFDQRGELVPLEYKILTDSGSTHTLFGGKEKKLYRCKF